MSDFHFLVRTGKLPSSTVKKLQKIAENNNSEFYHCNMPEGYKSWFSCKNRGYPFDASTARSVKTDIDTLKISY